MALKVSLFCPQILRFSLVTAHLFLASSFGQSVRLTTAQDAATRLPQVKVEGPAGVSGTVEVSARVRGGSWSALQNFTLAATPFVFIDRAAGDAAPRFYRVRTGSSAPVVTLPDLANSVDTVFPAGEGFDTIQFASDGTLGFIFWSGRDLTIRERNAAGSWAEQKVANDGNSLPSRSTLQYPNFQPAALLLYDSGSLPHIFRLSGGGTVAHYTRAGGTWTRSENIQVNGTSSAVRLVGAVGAGNVFHLGAVGNGGHVVYGTTRSGSWSWSTVVSIEGDPYWSPGSYNRRWFSLAVDSRNFAHFVYRPEFSMIKTLGYPRPYSKLEYVSNRGGSWVKQTIRVPDDDSGEVGGGMSIAIGANDLPSIASWYNERAPGGSAQWSRLQYYQMTPAGAWSRSEVVMRPDNYEGNDDEKGTGVQPYLRFDPQGRAHIIFLDHAAGHFPFQNEYAGNIRHAWWNGSQWSVETIYRQADPMKAQAVFPAFAVNGNELAVVGLERLTQWDTSVNPQIATSTYKFRFLLQPSR